MTPAQIEALIRAAIDADTVRVDSDDNVHFEALVVSEAFAGKRPVARHQMIYSSLGEHMRADIHALSIRALTPAEYAAS